MSKCPTYGLVTQVRQKVPGLGRNLALEAGSASHEFYGAARLWQIGYIQRKLDHFWYHGERIFGEERWAVMTPHLVNTRDLEANRQNFCLEALYTSGWYDDPKDTRRTMANIEVACLGYLNNIDWTRNVWIADENDPQSSIGVEFPIDVIIEWEDGYRVRYIGPMDGLMVSNVTKKLVLEENKTSSRLDGGWEAQMMMTHQVVGYSVGVRALLDLDYLPTVRCIGMQIPQPVRTPYSGHKEQLVHITDLKVEKWAQWVRFWHEYGMKYKNNIAEALRFTHSCNQYYHSCSLLHMCDGEKEDVDATIEEMYDTGWDPLSRGVKIVEGPNTNGET